MADFGVSEVLAAGAIVSAVASAGAGAVSTVSGIKKAEFEAQQYRQQQEFEKVAAAEQEVERRRELEQIQSAQQAMKGTDFYDAGSLKAIRREDERLAEFDIAGIKLQSKRRLNQLKTAEDQSKRAGQAALYGGVFTVAGSLTEAAYKGAKLIPGSPSAAVPKLHETVHARRGY